jgi:hypothetical protein
MVDGMIISICKIDISLSLLFILQFRLTDFGSALPVKHHTSYNVPRTHSVPLVRYLFFREDDIILLFRFIKQFNLLYQSKH